jgi:hypothetical protein
MPVNILLLTRIILPDVEGAIFMYELVLVLMGITPEEQGGEKEEEVQDGLASSDTNAYSIGGGFITDGSGSDRDDVQ